MELVRRVHRGSRMRAPSEASNLQILCFGYGKIIRAAHSLSLFPLIPLISRLAVTKQSMELVRRVHRGSHLRAPSEAANIIILRPGQGKDTFSSSSHQLCLTRLAVTKKEKVMRSTSTKARQRPQRSGNFFWSGLRIYFKIPADRVSRHDAAATRFVFC